LLTLIPLSHFLIPRSPWGCGDTSERCGDEIRVER
jgi:hypothetical protein